MRARVGRACPKDVQAKGAHFNDLEGACRGVVGRPNVADGSFAD